MVLGSAEDVHILVDDYRTRCLWFLRDDFYPMSRETRLRVLDYVHRHGDQDAFVRAAALRQWLLQSFNEQPAAS